MRMEYDVKCRVLDALRKYKTDKGPSPNSRRQPPTMNKDWVLGKPLPEYHDSVKHKRQNEMADGEVKSTSTKDLFACK